MVNGFERTDWTRALPNGKAISALGFGCAGIWSKPYFDDELAVEMLAEAFSTGVNHFDTSPSYGMTHGEQRLGTLLRRGKRDEMVISTKLGSNVFDGELVRSFTDEAIERSFEESLERLGTDWVDILYLHGPAVEDLNDRVFRRFEQLKADGRITYSGVNSFDDAVLERVVDSPIDVVMLQYNAEDQRCWRLIDRLHAAGKTVMSGTALVRGKFNPWTFLPRDRASLFYFARMARWEPLFLWEGYRLRKRLAAVPQPLAATSIQFALGHPKILSTFFSTRSFDHLVENIASGKRALTDEQWRKLLRNAGEYNTLRQTR
jgi:D-threo-aldose 1-dehydrogenase